VRMRTKLQSVSLPTASERILQAAQLGVRDAASPLAQSIIFMTSCQWLTAHSGTEPRGVAGRGAARHNNIPDTGGSFHFRSRGDHQIAVLVPVIIEMTHHSALKTKSGITFFPRSVVFRGAVTYIPTCTVLVISVCQALSVWIQSIHRSWLSPAQDMWMAPARPSWLCKHNVPLC
jgi:hypothetical protein